MKGILTFNLPEDAEDFKLAQRAGRMACALFDIRNEVFRPARKHGYSGEIGEFLNTLSEEEKDRALSLIGLLENKFSQVCEENDVSELT